MAVSEVSVHHDRVQGGRGVWHLTSYHARKQREWPELGIIIPQGSLRVPCAHAILDKEHSKHEPVRETSSSNHMAAQSSPPTSFIGFLFLGLTLCLVLIFDGGRFGEVLRSLASSWWMFISFHCCHKNALTKAMYRRKNSSSRGIRVCDGGDRHGSLEQQTESSHLEP